MVATHDFTKRKKPQAAAMALAQEELQSSFGKGGSGSGSREANQSVSWGLESAIVPGLNRVETWFPSSLMWGWANFSY